MNNQPTKFKLLQNSIKDFFENFKTLEIPLYQRSYCWKKDNVLTLLEDLDQRNKDKNEHYFGVIAKSTRKDYSSYKKEEYFYRIIDGQQRITTSIILLYYLSNKISDSHINEFIKMFGDIQFKYEIYESTIEDIIKIVEQENYKMINFKNKQIKDAYDVIDDFFKNKNIEYLKNILDTFLNKFIFVVLSYEIDREEEMLVFENLNSKGTPLKEYDLIKNSIILWNKNKEALDNLYKFNGIVFNLITNGKWNMSEGNAIKTFEKFLKSFLTWDNKMYTKYTSYSLYKNFKDYLKYTKISFSELLEKLRKYLIIYLSLEFPKNKNDIGEQLWFKVIDQKDVHMPLVFELFNKFSSFNENTYTWTNEKIIMKYMQVWSSHLIKLMSHSGTGQSFENLVNWFIEQIKNGDNPYQIQFKLKNKKEQDSKKIPPYGFTPSNLDFINSCLKEQKQIWISKSLLYIIENGKNLSYENIEYINYKTVEHIMPEKPNKEWREIINLDEDEFSEKHIIFKNQIGNLVFIDRVPNSTIGNNSFIEKRNNAYKHSASRLITSKGLEKWGLKPLDSYEEWSFNTIKERTKLLATIALDIMDDLNSF